ncbi:VanW family protein [Candidatus Microgenomates bacterium]|nr:VanW family protein [Candidatus Microgenomates bacterium]
MASKQYFLLRTIGVCLFLVFGVIIGGITFVIRQEQLLSNRIYPNVFIDDYPVANTTKAQAATILSHKNDAINNATISVIYKDAPVATMSATRLGLKYNTDEVIDRAYLIGRVNNTPSRIYQKITTHLKLVPYRFSTQLAYDTSYVQDFLTGKKIQYEKPAKNALFTFENGKVSEFKPEEKGLTIDEEKFTAELDAAIQSFRYNPRNVTLTLTDHIIDPEVTLAKANEFGIEEEIGVGKSDYSHSIPERIHNVILGATKLNGVLIPKGESFSFNKYLGDIDAAHGFQPAYVIQNGKTVLGDGGGICQVSTTMFRAAMNAGLPITERHAHAYRVGYYENDAKPGLDATIYLPTVDFKFKNDTPGALLIQTEIVEDQHLLLFHLFGKKDGRKAELTDPILTNVAPPPPALNQEDPTLPRGVTKQVDFAAWGGRSSFNYKVTYPDNKIEEQTFVSVYRPWQAIFLVGTKDS